MRQKLLSAIENHARISAEDLAAITCSTVPEIEKELEKLELERIICGYHTLINWDKVGEEKADALIEVKVTPQKGVGFDQMADKICKYPEVTSMYLISGSCDFVLFIEENHIHGIYDFIVIKQNIHGKYVITHHVIDLFCRDESSVFCHHIYKIPSFSAS